MKITPVSDRILVEPLAVEDKKSALWIPESAKEKPQVCIIKKLGLGKLVRDADGRIHTEPFQVREGQKVIVSRYGGSEVVVEGLTFKLIAPDDILAIVEG